MKKHIDILDHLRGFAALAVVFFHFSNSTLPTIKPNLLTDVFYYGKYGVHVFFVISGFIIPYSMHRSGYVIGNYGKNLMKRFIRISPPAYVSIAMSFALYYGAVLVLGRPIDGFNWPGAGFLPLMANLTYTVPFFDTMWYNDVFWTLAIEFQFYILIGLALPLLTRSKDSWIALAILALTLGLNIFPQETFFLYSPFFVLGMIIFLKNADYISKPAFLVLAVSALLFILIQKNPAEFLFGLGSFLIIAINPQIKFKPTQKLGLISYSLYITHTVVGVVSEIVLKQFIQIHIYPWGKIVLLFVYVTITIIFASIFYRLIERPFINWSKNFGRSTVRSTLAREYNKKD